MFDRLDESGLSHLIERYRAHAHFEETEFVPLANRLLESAEGGLDDLAVSIHKRHAGAYGRSID